MDSVETIGSVAGILTTIAFVPQVIKTWRTRSTKDISLYMFLIMCSGIVLWIIYGALKGSWPLIGANVATLILAGTILYLKFRGQ